MHHASPADRILAHLRVVDRERAARADDASLHERVQAVKRFQQRRFSHTYADLLTHARYAKATAFFLDELYGPADFTQRDKEFARVVPALVRLFPRSVVETVETLASLHALSEELDSAMGAQSPLPVGDAHDYVRAWLATGQPEAREQQIQLTLQVGRSLDELTRKPLLRQSLHFMRGPARAAGLMALQQFLETGFDAFAAMRGASDFLALVDQREHRLAQSLFAFDAEAKGHDPLGALGQLP